MLIKQVFAIKVGCFPAATPHASYLSQGIKRPHQELDLDLQTQFPEYLHLCCGDRAGRSQMSSEVIFQMFLDWY